MARPVHADAAATRRKILQVACDRFASDGLGQTSMRAIARAADVSQATIHHYFVSKDALYRACVDAMYTQVAGIRDAFTANMAMGTHPAGVLRAALPKVLAFARDHRSAIMLVQRSVMDHGEGAHDDRSALLFPALEGWAKWLSRFSPLDEAAIYQTLYAFNLLVVRVVLVEDSELRRVYGEGEPIHDVVGQALAGLVIRALQLEE